jgi:hypothetical protein
MGWPKGVKKGPGTKAPGSGMQKGQKIARTKALQDAILQALDKAGGVDYLVWLSKEQPVAFASLLGRVLPTTVSGDASAPLRVVFTRADVELL